MSAHTYSPANRDDNAPVIIVMLGAPGSGKGTNAAMLSEQHHIPTISTGDLLRSIGKQEDPIALEVKGIIASGQLVSDQLVNKVLLQRLLQKDCANGFILDGFPRNMAQVEFLRSVKDEHFSKYELMVFYIDVDPEEIVARISKRFICLDCGQTYNLETKKPLREGYCDSCHGHNLGHRADDEPEVIRKRLAVYAQQTLDVLNFYREHDNFFAIPGNESISAIQRGIIAHVKAALSKQK